jgi:hypothetical protein
MEGTGYNLDIDVVIMLSLLKQADLSPKVFCF